MQRVTHWAAALSVAAVSAFGSISFAAEQRPPVTLQAKDGSVQVTGTLLEIDGNFFIVKTPGMGVLRVDSRVVDCIGIVCPVVKTFEPKFGIHGSRTVGTTLIPKLLRGYARSIGATFEMYTPADASERVVTLKNPDGTVRVEIDLHTKGSGSAFKALGAGIAEIGLADRRMKDSDLAKLAVGGIGDLRNTENETVLGVDGIVLITHPDNPVPNLSAMDVARIWSGEITNWKELGGGDFPITVNSFGESSGDRAVLIDALVRPNNRDEKPDVVRWKAYQDMIDSVMADRGGIGFVGRWLARTNNVNLLAIREECGLLSPPTDFRMKIEGYSLSRRLYAYTKPGEMHPEARAFLDWTLTSEAQAYIKESNFIDRELERMRLEDMGMMLVHTAAVEPDFDGVQYAEMMRVLRNADRLSISFRFKTGSSTLDVESVRNLRELAARMNANEFDGHEIMLVGFADSVGDRVRNTRLAASRAHAIREVLLRSLDPDAVRKLKLTPLSFGELLPLSCNTDDVGRSRNRRVEVWLRTPSLKIAGR